MQLDRPEDFVTATGLQYSLRQFIEWMAPELGMKIRCEGESVNEVGYASKAKSKLGWTPQITAQEMCKETVAEDLSRAKQHGLLESNGYNINDGQE